MLARVFSLLSGTANLRFIRMLNTGRFGVSTTEAIDVLLPQLQENALTEFNFSDEKKISSPHVASYVFSGAVRKDYRTYN